MAGKELPELHVEGTDDQHVIIHLLARHGITLDKQLGPVAIRSAGNDRSVLEAIDPAVRLSTKRAVGFVIDCDVACESRWTRVRDRMRDIGIDVPESLPPEGLIITSSKYKSTIGIWIMPDCQTDLGTLEHFVEALVPQGDGLWPHAETSTTEAQYLGAQFASKDELKARIHAWLAWQEAPGLPYGTAIKAKFFSHDSPAADAFVNWFKTLFGLI